MLGLFFRSKKEKERVAGQPVDPQASGGHKKQPHEEAGPDSPMKKQRVAAQAGAAAAGGAGAATSASASAHRHSRAAAAPQPPPLPPPPARGTEEEAALLAELADAEWTLSAGGEPGIAAGVATIRAAVQAVAELRGRWRTYARANDAAALGPAAAAGASGSHAKAGKAGKGGGGGKHGGASCPGPLTAKEKLELSEMGLRAQLTLDGAETGGRADVRALRKRATAAAEALLDAVAAAPVAAARPTPPPSPRAGGA